MILENHQVKCLWNRARRGQKSEHFDGVNNLAITDYCHSCSNLIKSTIEPKGHSQEVDGSGKELKKNMKTANLQSLRSSQNGWKFHAQSIRGLGLYNSSSESTPGLASLVKSPGSRSDSARLPNAVLHRRTHS